MGQALGFTPCWEQVLRLIFLFGVSSGRAHSLADSTAFIPPSYLRNCLSKPGGLTLIFLFSSEGQSAF